MPPSVVGTRLNTIDTRCSSTLDVFGFWIISLPPPLNSRQGPFTDDNSAIFIGQGSVPFFHFHKQDSICTL